MRRITYPVLPGFQNDSTSRDAANSMLPELSFLRSECARILKGGDFTADEVADAIGRSVLAIRPRITELYKLELIDDTGRRRPNDSGRKAIVWHWKHNAPSSLDYDAWIANGVLR